MFDGSTTALAEWLRSNSQPFRVAGGGTWLSAGRPVSASQVLSMHDMRGVVEYVPGDLTMTARAGTPLGEIDAITAAEGQWLGLDPAGSSAGTIGATVATASAGPLVHGIGAMRDIVLGMEVVSGNGIITRSGGKVVKNVAGFDLVRLQTGAWGTLGVIAEISLRLRARPEIDETVALELDARTPLLAHLVRFRNLTLAPLAAELVGAPLAEALGLAHGMLLVVRLGGNSTRVAAQRNLLATFGPIISGNTDVWSLLRQIECAPEVPTGTGMSSASVGTSAPPSPLHSHAVARVSHLPSQLANAWAHVQMELSAATLAPAFVRATISRGLIRVVIPQPAAHSDEAFTSALTVLTHSLAPPGGHVVWEQLPAQAWDNVPSSVADELSHGLQRTFDPGHHCNPGILGASFVK